MATVLIADDDRKIIDMLRRTLAYEGYHVVTAADGQEALAKALAHRPDVVVLDWLMPGVDGLEVARRLREADGTPILMLTARDAVEDRVEGLDSGADDYLVKPFAFRELLARVRALLRRDGRSKDPVLRVGDVEIDTVSREVRRHGRSIELTSKEYAVLEFFARNPNRVLTRTQIAEHVWDYDFVAMSNVVDVYVGYLRRKLGDFEEPRLLRTVRGTGYQFKAPTS